MPRPRGHRPSIHRVRAPDVDVDTLLVDIDGTLIDSNDAHAQTWRQALREHGIDAAADSVRRRIGMGADKLLAAFGVDEMAADGRAITTRKKDLFNRALPRLKPTPGARALLEYLRARRIAVVVATSADDRETSALLQRAGVEDLIPHRASKDAAPSSKPEPDIVKAALARAGASRRAAIMVGDTPYDIEAANRAGVDTIALRCGGYWSDDDLRGALAILDDPAALLACWRARDR